MSKRLQFGVAAIAVLTVALSTRTLAQTDTPDRSLGTIVGTVMDVNGDTVPGAIVVLQGTDRDDRGQLVTGENGFFEFAPSGQGCNITSR